jgi:hypothetical protein
VQVPAGVREQRPGAGRRREPVVQHFLREHRRCRPGLRSGGGADTRMDPVVGHHVCRPAEAEPAILIRGLDKCDRIFFCYKYKYLYSYLNESTVFGRDHGPC